MNMIDPVLRELSHEAPVTRKVLERAPEDQFGWKPHEKSMTLGRLVTHIAESPGWVANILPQDEFVMDPASFKPTVAESVAQVLDMFDKNVALASSTMQGMADERLLATWRLKIGDEVKVEMPRIGMIRVFLLNHLYHHRGQLTVYLRLLDVPVPAVYGPSADEDA